MVTEPSDGSVFARFNGSSVCFRCFYMYLNIRHHENKREKRHLFCRLPLGTFFVALGLLFLEEHNIILVMEDRRDLVRTASGRHL